MTVSAEALYVYAPKLEKVDNKTLVIREIPYGKTVASVCDSIVKASEKGKIKIKKVEDLTSENVEILVHLAPGVSSDKTIDALYAFTDCEVSISPNCCVIDGAETTLSHRQRCTEEVRLDDTLALLRTKNWRYVKTKYWKACISLHWKKYSLKSVSTRTRNSNRPRIWMLPANTLMSV